MLIFLGLQGFKVTRVEIEEEGIMLRVERTRKTGTCPWCGKRTKHLHQYRKELRLRHRFLAGKKLYLVGRKRRWAQRTMRAEEEILRLIRDNSFKRLEERWGISAEVARGLVKKIELGPSWEEEKRQREVRLGGDEHSFRGRNLVVTVPNLRRGKVFTILGDDRQQTFRDFLEGIPEVVKGN